MPLAAPTPLADVPEKLWQAQVIDLARMLGWRHQFTWRSKRSPAGWPDLVLVRERLLLLELKTETGKLSPLQREWLRALHAAGQEAYVVRPRDLDSIARVLAHHGDVRSSGEVAHIALALREQTQHEAAA